MTFRMAFIFVTISPMIYLAFDSAVLFLFDWVLFRRTQPTHSTLTPHAHTRKEEIRRYSSLECASPPTQTRARPYTRKEDIGSLSHKHTCVRVHTHAKKRLRGSLTSGARFPHTHVGSLASSAWETRSTTERVRVYPAFFRKKILKIGVTLGFKP
jgi:hypothetical protein